MVKASMVLAHGRFVSFFLSFDRVTHTNDAPTISAEIVLERRLFTRAWYANRAGPSINTVAAVEKGATLSVFNSKQNIIDDG